MRARRSWPVVLVFNAFAALSLVFAVARCGSEVSETCGSGPCREGRGKPNDGGGVLDGPAIGSGGYRLDVAKVDGELGVSVSKDGRVLYAQPKPLEVEIKNAAGEPVAYAASYAKVDVGATEVVATGSVKTAAGSQLDFTDTFSARGNDGTYQLARSVVVKVAKDSDVGFGTRFGLAPTESNDLHAYDMFVPGVWYGQNENAVPGAIGNVADYDSLEHFYVRETRMALPLFMLSNRSSGEAIAIGHLGSAAASNVDEWSTDWHVDPSIQYASLGLHRGDKTTLDFVYPGSEGDKTYASFKGLGWARRSHPVRTNGITHEYSVVLRVGHHDRFADAMRDAWRYFYDVSNPAPAQIDLPAIYGSLIDSFKAYYRDDCKTSGGKALPWATILPNDGLKEYHAASGFVGQQLYAAFLLVRHGLKNGDASATSKGSAMADFWASSSMTACGLPRTDYFCDWSPDGWVKDPLFLRTMSDGMEGALEAYRVSLARGSAHPQWLAYAKRFGDWLVDHQNADGSYYRSYKHDCSPAETAKLNTTNPVRFLVALASVTNDGRYLEAAKRAGEFSLVNVDAPFRYVGGTPDNANTIDKEAGVEAMRAFLALYGATHDVRWLDAARRAADYAESWTFAWTYRVYPDTATRWAANGPSLPQWLVVDLGQGTDITRVETQFEFVDSGYKYSLETSDDGQAWTVYADRKNNTALGNPEYRDEGAAHARYVRLTVSGAAGWASVRELKVYRGEENVALARPVTASSSDAAHPAPLAVDGDRSPWPECGLVGQSLVATGHSYVDMFMTYAAADYYRLYLYSGDAHYLAFAKILQKNANAPTDWRGKLGYPYRGLQLEGSGVDTFRHTVKGDSLTWCAVAELHPLTTLEDTFGAQDIDAIESKLSLDDRKKRNDVGVVYAPP